MPTSVTLAERLASVVERFHGLAEILDAAVGLIAAEMSADACSILLLNPRDRRLHLMATRGLDEGAIGKVSLAAREGLVGRVATEMRPIAVERAAAHPDYHYVPETGEERYESFLGVPLVIRERAIGVVAVQTIRRRAFRDDEVRGLETLAAQLVGVVANALLIEALDRGDRGDQVLVPVVAPPREEASREPGVIRGCAASPGIAMGAVAFRGSYVLDLGRDDLAAGEPAFERDRLREGLARTREDVLQIQRDAAHESDEEHALIFSSHLLLLNDPVLMEHMDRSIARGASAPVAVEAAYQEFAGRLEAIRDPYIQERMEDIHDLRSRILDRLLGNTRAPLGDCVVVANRIPPSLIVEIKTRGARGLVTEVGGTTSHGVLLARSMRLPVVTGVSGAAGLLRSGDFVVVDGTSGTVHVNAPPETIAAYRDAALQAEHRRTEHARYRDLPARTADGTRVRLRANVSIAADLAVAQGNGAEAVGLYRTEFPFILREEFPTREEQVKIYRRAYEAFPEGPINFRLLDLGGDKFVPGGAVQTSRNPFEGYRSIRVLFDHPQVLTDQVQAFALAAGTRPLRLLIPMVSSIEELRRVRLLVDAALGQLAGREAVPRPEVGVMIELPAAVEIAAEIAREADFLSIGTNDLIQYSLVVDREDSRLSTANDPYHPAILRMIRRVVDAAHGEGRSVSVCGEMAADRSLAVLLVALGVDELSVAPHAIPEVKQCLGAVDLGALSERLRALLSLPGAEEIRAGLRGLLAGA